MNRTIELLILDFRNPILFLVLLFGKMVIESNGFFIFGFMVERIRVVQDFSRGFHVPTLIAEAGLRLGKHSDCALSTFLLGLFWDKSRP